MKFHSIRLHGPWQAEVVECSQPGIREYESTKRIKLPSDWGEWLGAEFRGKVVFKRPFGLPTRLDPGQQVWLVLESVDYRAVVTLNGNRLGSFQFGEPFRAGVREFLQHANVLTVEVDVPLGIGRGDRAELAGGLIGSIRLEIQE